MDTGGESPEKSSRRSKRYIMYPLVFDFDQPCSRKMAWEFRALYEARRSGEKSFSRPRPPPLPPAPISPPFFFEPRF